MTIAVNPVSFSWTDPTTNVDGSPIVAGEITGYQIGIRPASGAVGTYPVQLPSANVAAVTENLNALTPTLANAGSSTTAGYFASIQTLGPVDSPWSAEVGFSLVPPTPSAPSNFSVA